MHIRILARELALPRSIVALFNYILLLLMLTLTKGKNKKKNAKHEDSMPSIFRKKAKRVSKSECFFCAIMYREVRHRIVLYFYNAFRAEAYRMH